MHNFCGMEEYYYLDVKRKVQGPHSLEELAGMLRAGVLTASTEVAAPGDARWVPLGSLVTPSRVEAAQLPPVPGVSGAPGKCPSCAAELKPEKGELPILCARCGRVLRSVKGGFWGNLLLPFCQYARFSGRATRAEYWVFVITFGLLWAALFLGGMVAMIAGATLPGQNETLIMGGSIAILAFAVTYLVMLLPSMALQVRRLHDVGFSGWWVGVYVVGTLVYTLSYYGLCWGQFVAIHRTVKTGLLSGDSSWVNELSVLMDAEPSLALTLLSMANLLLNMLFLMIVVLSLLDSQRGPNKYGPSRKYPMG